MQAKLKKEKEILAALKRLEKLQMDKSFDPVNPDSRPTPGQQVILDDLRDIELQPGEFYPAVQYRYVVAGNQSGKTTLAARELAWIVTDTHPTWKRPARWGEEPLLILMAGQDRRMMEIEIWTKKIRPFLNINDWREVRVGGMLTFVEHRDKGHKIVFMSHNDSSESNRAHMQGFVAHYVWLDEMPRKINILEELQRRVDARRGYFIATFTPKSRNEAIKKVIEAAEPPIAKRYRLSKLDNPLYAPNKEAEIKKLEGYTEEQKNTILYGDWTGGDNFVYQFDTEKMVVEQLPSYYSRTWRHVVSVDPALKSKFGFTLWGEDPGTGIWYLVKDDYIIGVYSPDDIVHSVQLATKGYNIVKRISDPHESWFIGQAAKFKIPYVYPFDKSSRKQELIKNLQIALSNGKIKILASCRTFLDEIQGCQFAEGTDRIVNSSSYHALDCAQYFVDMIPPYDESQRVMGFYEELRSKNEERKKKEVAQRVAAQQTARSGRIQNLRPGFRRFR